MLMNSSVCYVTIKYRWTGCHGKPNAKPIEWCSLLVPKKGVEEFAGLQLPDALRNPPFINLPLENSFFPNFWIFPTKNNQAKCQDHVNRKSPFFFWLTWSWLVIIETNSKREWFNQINIINFASFLFFPKSIALLSMKKFPLFSFYSRKNFYLLTC